MEKVMVIDDSRAIRRILGETMRELGFEVWQAANGREALEQLGAIGPPVRLMLIDWNMPEMNGLEFVTTVRADDRFDSSLLVMVTTETAIDQMVRALDAGANEYIMNPSPKRWSPISSASWASCTSPLLQSRRPTVPLRATQSLPPGRRIRALVVDDSVGIRRLVTQALSEDNGIEVVGAAANGSITLSKIPQVNPDVITLDIEMPEMDGLETLRQVRKQYPSLCVIMFSTLTERGATQTLEALSLGANDYVTKAANAGSLGQSLERLRNELIGVCT